MAALSAAALLALPVPGAAADVYPVTTLANSGEGSLRDRISDANADTTGAPHTVDATGVNGTILLASGLPTLTRNMTIQGPGANVLTVYRNSVADQYRPFSIGSGVTATIRGLTIRNGSVSSGQGGGIDNAGILTLDRSAVIGNFAQNGGGIRTWRALTVQNSTVSGNSASTLGGGIYTSTAAVGQTSTVTVRNSTVAGNTAGGTSGRRGDRDRRQQRDDREQHGEREHRADRGQPAASHGPDDDDPEHDRVEPVGRRR